MNNNTTLFIHKGGAGAGKCKDACQYKDMQNATIVSLADGVLSKKVLH